MDSCATSSIKSPSVPRRIYPARYPVRSAQEIHSRSRVMDTSRRKVKYRRLNTNQCGNTINTDPFTYAPWLRDAKGGVARAIALRHRVHGVHFSGLTAISPELLQPPTHTNGYGGSLYGGRAIATFYEYAFRLLAAT